ncbi:hypothetical protein ACQ4LE_008888 [Meloidogyne hapla]
MGDRVLRSHHTRAKKEMKISNQAEKIFKDLQKSIKRNRFSSADLINKRKEFEECMKREKEKTAEMKRLRDVPIKFKGPRKDFDDNDGGDLINKLKERHRKMTEAVDKEIEFVLNLCKELDINVDDIKMN